MTVPHPPPVADAAVVLLVEDEIDLREIMELLLVTRGYQVLTAGDGVEALKLFKQYGRTLSVVLTDLRLPRLNGLPMLRAIRKADRKIPFVVVSGTIADWPPSEFDGLHIKALIDKPFTTDQLLNAISNAIGRPKNSGPAE